MMISDVVMRIALINAKNFVVIEQRKAHFRPGWFAAFPGRFTGSEELSHAGVQTLMTDPPVT